MESRGVLKRRVLDEKDKFGFDLLMVALSRVMVFGLNRVCIVQSTVYV